MRNSIFLAYILIVFCACEPPVVFDQPYPQNRVDLEQIPKQFHGDYLCESDSSLVRIAEQNIIHESYYEFRSNIKDLEEKEDCTIRDNQIFIKGISECVPLKYINDSIVAGQYVMVDTLFKNRYNAFARIYKGHLFLSQKIKTEEWMVHFLTPVEGDLIYRAIVDRSNISEIKKLTPVENLEKARNDSPRYRIKPTKQEFDKLIENKRIFIECEYLIRINLEIEPNCKYPIRSKQGLEFKY